MKNRYIQVSYKSEQSPKIEDKGISLWKLILLAVAIALIGYATKKGIDKDIILALLDLLK